MLRLFLLLLGSVFGSATAQPIPQHGIWGRSGQTAITVVGVRPVTATSGNRPHRASEGSEPRLERDGHACTPGYDPCIPPGPDVDCAGGRGDGPRYVEGPIVVTGSDPYQLDRDRDGIGCS